jgi:uncharacterized phage protein (TIGR01671 family)
MTKPKFRAWFTIGEEMIATSDILAIDFENNELLTQEVYFERGLAVERDENRYHFDEIKLMQSTGRKDTSENEIFAGDILKVTDKHEGKDGWLEVVSYSEEKAMFVTDEVNKNFKAPAAPLYSLFDTDLFIVEIVGNIYEQPELVGNKQ